MTDGAVTKSICDLKHEALQEKVNENLEVSKDIKKILNGNGEIGLVAKVDNNSTAILALNGELKKRAKERKKEKEEIDVFKQIAKDSMTRTKYALWIMIPGILSIIASIILQYLKG